jgi:hypothetical protein
MSFLDGLAPAVGAAGGSLLGGLMDTSNQEYLMQKQDKINKENATIAYNRQRELTQDQALLHKRGMEQAGYNTAFGSNGNVTSSANVDQASPVSVPSPQGYGQQLSTAFGSFLQNSLVNAQRRNVDADTNAKNIDNATRAIKNALEIGKQKQDIGVSMLNYAKDAFKFAVDKQYYDRQQSAQTDEMEANAKRAQALQAIEEVNAMFQYSKNDADLQKAYQEFENLKKVYDLTDAQIVTEKGKPRVQLSEINKNNASAAESRSAVVRNHASAYESRKHGDLYDVETDIKSEGKDDTLSILHSGRIKAWYDALPHDMQQVMMSSYGFRDALAKVQRGENLDAHDKAVLAAVLGYENASKFTQLLFDAINVRRQSKAPTTKRTIVEHRSSKK